MSDAPNYWDYLHLNELLSLQGGLEGEDTVSAHELHFITVHQTYELWFKMVLRSLRVARDALNARRVDEDMVPVVAHHLRRASSILRLGVAQMEVMETLTPQDFLDFRAKLVPASGFQSFQMRELEILMGLEESERIHYGGTDPISHIEEFAGDSPAGILAKQRIRAVRDEKTLLACLYDWLYRTPVQGSTPDDDDDFATVGAFLDDFLRAIDDNCDDTLARLEAALGVKEGTRERFDGIKAAARDFLYARTVPEPERARIRRIRAAALFIESYRHLPLLSWPRLLLDVVVELEEQLVLWRHRHARMVERLIGRRVGTGGSSGVDYLDKTGRYRVFRDLWQIRTLLLPKANLPEITDEHFYGFIKE